MPHAPYARYGCNSLLRTVGTSFEEIHSLRVIDPYIYYNFKNLNDNEFIVLKIGRPDDGLRNKL
jgi:hypothetical protein